MPKRDPEADTFRRCARLPRARERGRRFVFGVRVQFPLEGSSTAGILDPADKATCDATRRAVAVVVVVSFASLLLALRIACAAAGEADAAYWCGPQFFV